MTVLPGGGLPAVRMSRTDANGRRRRGGGRWGCWAVGWASALEELEDRGDEFPVVLEDAAVAGVRIDRQRRVRDPAGDVGRVAAGDHDVVIAVGHEDRLADLPEVVGRLQAGRADRLELCAPGLQGDPLVAVLGALLQTGDVVGRGALAVRRPGAEQVVPGLTQRERGLDVRGGRDPGDLLDAATAGGTRAGQNDPTDELGMLEGDHLRDAATE